MVKTTQDYSFVRKDFGDDLVIAANKSLKEECYNFVTWQAYSSCTFWEFLVDDTDARYTIWAYIIDKLINGQDTQDKISTLIDLVDLARKALIYTILYEDYLLGTLDMILNIPELAAFHDIANTLLTNFNELKLLDSEEIEKLEYYELHNKLLKEIELSCKVKETDYRALVLHELSL
jgi:hypothetical protein